MHHPMVLEAGEAGVITARVEETGELDSTIIPLLSRTGVLVLEVLVVMGVLVMMPLLPLR